VNDCVVTEKELGEVCDALQIYTPEVEECTQCNEYLTNCLACSDPRTCTSCYAGYFPIHLEDVDGPYTTCIWNFCGYDTVDQLGFTSDCV